MTGSDVAGNVLAGYRVVRKLGSGSRADVFVASGETGVVALKVFRPETPASSVGTELDALGRLDSAHFVRLRDVETDSEQTPILILDLVRRGSVAGLLRDRDSLETGEVVTLIAPMAVALPGLHRAGVGHGNINASTLHLGARGQPVLIGFGHAELFARDGSIAAIDAEPAAARDRDALALIAIALLSRVRNAATNRGVVALIEWIETAPHEFEFCERLEARLFELADAIPIEFASGAATLEVPARFGFSDPLIDRSAPEAVAAPTPDGPSGLVGWLDAALRDNPLELAKSRVVGFAKGVRKPFWFAAGGGVLALVLAIAFIPQGASAPTPTATAAAASERPLPAPSALPADPVQALPLLLADRSQCIRSISVLCLDDVDDDSSSAYAADAALIQQLQEGTELPDSAIIVAPAPTLVETLGNSAIVSLGSTPEDSPANTAQPHASQSDPAPVLIVSVPIVSVLMIKSEAGWRIRGYLTGIQATGSPVGQNVG